VVTALNLAHTEEVQDMSSGMEGNANDNIVKDVQNGELYGILIVEVVITMLPAAFVRQTALMVLWTLEFLAKRNLMVEDGVIHSLVPLD
jgi:hypothetical protein